MSLIRGYCFMNWTRSKHTVRFQKTRIEARDEMVKKYAPPIHAGADALSIVCQAYSAIFQILKLIIPIQHLHDIIFSHQPFFFFFPHKMAWRVMWCAGVENENSHKRVYKRKSILSNAYKSVDFAFRIKSESSQPAQRTLSQQCSAFCFVTSHTWSYIHLSAALGEDEHAHCWWQHSPLHVHFDGSHPHRPGYQTGIRCVLTSRLLGSTMEHLCFYRPLWLFMSMPSSALQRPCF